MKVTAYLFLKLNLIKAGQPTRRIFGVGKACITSFLFATSVFTVFLQTAAKAQITPATNDAGTVVNQNGNTLNIEGGTKARANLLHSFDKFGVNQGQTANFLSNPSIQNILGRVTGGDASVINGLIQVTGGNSNLYLMNPAGIIFGSGGSLNVPASFTATTANGIGLGDKWFNAVGTNDYASLLGNPTGFAFTQSGTIFNAGNLAVASGQNLTLVGGTVVNTGMISAPSGNITIAAVPGEKLVRITQEGSLLSLGLPVETKAAINPQPFTPLSLPQLLTGGNLSGATGVTVENGVVKLTGSGVTIPNTPGTAVVSNQVNVSGTTGGTVNVLGDKVGLVGANINASGTNGGGTVLVGGDYKGQGTVPNASQTFVSRDSTINADALQNGNGGRVITWADGTNRFYGNISARGGASSGDGGFVEVSGKQNLTFDGLVDLETTVGKNGLLLLDPFAVRITTDAPPGGNQISGDDRFFFSPGQAEIRESSLSSYTFYITPSRIVELLQGADVSIAAQNSVQVEKEVNATGNSRISNLTLTANSVNVNSPIRLNTGSNLILKSTATAASSTGGIDIFGNLATNSGDITLNSDRPIKLNSTTLATKGGNVTFNGPVIISQSFSAPTVDTTGTTGTGNITFTRTIDSDSFASFPGSLELKARGDVNVQGAIGGNKPIRVFSIGDFNLIGANNVSLKDFQGDALQVNAQGNVTLNTTGSLVTQPIIRSFGGGNIQLTATGDINLKDGLVISFKNAGTGEVLLNSQAGNLALENMLVEASTDVKLQGQSINVRKIGSNSSSLEAGQDLIVQARGNSSTLKIDDMELRAGRNLRLTAAQGNIALQNVTVAGRTSLGDTDIRLLSRSLSINNSQIQADTDLNALVQTDLTVDNSKLQAYRDLTLQTQNNLNLKASEVAAGQNLQLQAQGASGKVRVEDVTDQAIARSGKDITISGTQAIDIQALNNPQSVFRSGGNFTFISNGAVTGNGRFISGGDFAIRNLANNPGDFRHTHVSSNGIISAAGDISFGNNYTGTSLKVEAGGSITGGDIEITGANTTLSGTDSDIAILSSNPSLILRAGLSELRQTPNVLPSETELRNSPNVSPGFTTSGGSANAIIRVGKINISTSDNGADTVILSAPGGITTGAIISDGGSVKLTSSNGNIIVDTINTRRNSNGGGSVDISSKGVFQATGSFDFTYQDLPPGFVTSPTSILTGTGGIGLDGKTLEGSIKIRQGGTSFVENYAPGTLPDNVGGTAGRILIADGSNASLVSSYRDRIFVDSLGKNSGDGGTNNGGTNNDGTNNGGTNNGGSDNNNTLSRTEQQNAQRQVISQSNGSACNASTTVATAPQPSDSRTGDASNQTVSNPPAVSNNCTPANNDQQILKILDETPNSGQNKELYFDSYYPRFGEFTQQATFKN